MVPLFGGLFAPCDPSRPRAPRGAAGPWCSRTRPTPHGRSRGPRGPECTPHDDRVVLTSPPRPRAGWALEPRSGTGLRKLLALLESRAFPVRSWLCLGDLSKLEVARPATCSTCRKTCGSRGCSPAGVNSAGCCLRSRCVLLCGEMQGSRRKKWEWVPLPSPINGLCQNASDPAYSVHATWRLELSAGL